MKGTEQEMLQWMENSVSAKKPDDRFAIVSTGNAAQVEQTIQTSGNVIHSFSSKTGTGETNLELGLQLAGSIIPKGRNGRIVVFSDGNENAGSILDAAHLLKQKGMVLDVVPLKGTASNDLAASEFSVPPAQYIGEEAQIQLKVSSNFETKAIVLLSLNDRELLRREVSVKQGDNLFDFSHEVKETGLVMYKAEIVADGDTFAENNTLYAVSNIKGTPQVLMVSSEGNPAFAQALESSGLLVDQISPEMLPSVLSGYLEYHSIVFDNVPATAIGERKMGLIEQAVHEFGTGFVMTGGDSSFGIGGYFKTPAEKILPVHMEIKGKEEMPSLGLVIVLDRSGSMQGQKLSLAKEAAARSVELLREKDTLGFIAFDDEPWEIIEAGPIENKKQAADKIRSVPDGGGTNIFPALQAAYDSLGPLKLQRKHIILLTDGQSEAEGDYKALIEKGKETSITLSTVALGQDADKTLLENLAEMGTGRFYNVTDDTVIPSILSRETAMVTRTYIVDDPFYPEIHPHIEWSGLFDQGVPRMNAYIAVTPKGTARTLLSSEKQDPILAEWQYGLGKTLAFMSDTSGKWAGDWARWEKWPAFLNKIVAQSLPSYDSEPFSHIIRQEGGETILELSSATDSVLPIEAAVFSQTGVHMDANTKMTAPGKFELKMEHNPGVYFLHIRQKGKDGTDKVHQTGFSIPYSEEYLQKGINEDLLMEASSITGGKKLDQTNTAFSELPVKNVSRQPISQWLLLAAFLLFFADIAGRRFGWHVLAGWLLKSLSFMKRKPKVPSETFSLKRSSIEKKKKHSIRVQADASAMDAKEVQGIEEHIRTRQSMKPSSETKAVNKTMPSDSMQRLLDAKRKRNK
ncbi:MAG TPA: VWA domain-containing protein, partial [Bacillaceae bacterium]